MIIATIQGTDTSSGGKHISACDGRLVENQEQDKCLEKLFSIINHSDINNNENEGFYAIANEYYLCLIQHPKKDDIGRTRIALVLFSQNENEDIVHKTLDIMGLEYDRFKNLRQKYLVSKNNTLKTQRMPMLVVACAVVGGGLAYTYKDNVAIVALGAVIGGFLGYKAYKGFLKINDKG
ncbi:hypothetical protein DMB92_00205 [Campylobacter sp. MIT 99-7217]|uniref:hypothetical protein n=1 Tax=Campylobacter sp. MIT 99-7217 TaxID=535091 RepID=UPI00115C039A|nr:hypothetical protein [Campylobacter sp. MIT 99-7217]TQR34426.1 hypothetical protein DMB92_00205 [Campylobacter sp. MIT 99-7217]